MTCRCLQQEKIISGGRHGAHLSGVLCAHGAHEHRAGCPPRFRSCSTIFCGGSSKIISRTMSAWCSTPASLPFATNFSKNIRRTAPRCPMNFPPVAIRAPAVRSMRLPIWSGTDSRLTTLLGALAKQATKANLDVMLVTNDKDMLQLVNEGVRVLRTGTGAAKSDVFVDEKRSRKF